MKKYFCAAIVIVAVIFLSLKDTPVNASVDIELPKLSFEKYEKFYAYNDEDVHWLALNMYHEARGESDKGMIAVSQVVLNRVHAGIYPDSVKRVVTQKNGRSCAFSWYCDGQSDVPKDREMWLHCVLLARVVLDNYNPMHHNNDVMFYHARRVDPRWNNKMIKVASIGNHVFYKE